MCLKAAVVLYFCVAILSFVTLARDLREMIGSGGSGRSEKNKKIKEKE